MRPLVEFAIQTNFPVATGTSYELSISRSGGSDAPALPVEPAVPWTPAAPVEVPVVPPKPLEPAKPAPGRLPPADGALPEAPHERPPKRPSAATPAANRRGRVMRPRQRKAGAIAIFGAGDANGGPS